MTEPDHMHVFVPSRPRPGSLPSPISLTQLFCYQEDCYVSLDRQMYPPDVIGPKLVPRSQKEKR